MLRTIGTAVLVAIGFSVVALMLLSIPYRWIGLTWTVTGFAISA